MRAEISQVVSEVNGYCINIEPGSIGQLNALKKSDEATDVFNLKGESTLNITAKEFSFSNPVILKARVFAETFMDFSDPSKNKYCREALQKFISQITLVIPEDLVLFQNSILVLSGEKTKTFFEKSMEELSFTEEEKPILFLSDTVPTRYNLTFKVDENRFNGSALKDLEYRRKIIQLSQRAVIYWEGVLKASGATDFDGDLKSLVMAFQALSACDYLLATQEEGRTRYDVYASTFPLFKSEIGNQAELFPLLFSPPRVVIETAQEFQNLFNQASAVEQSQIIKGLALISEKKREQIEAAKYLRHPEFFQELVDVLKLQADKINSDLKEKDILPTRSYALFLDFSHTMSHTRQLLSLMVQLTPPQDRNLRRQVATFQNELNQLTQFQSQLQTLLDRLKQTVDFIKELHDTLPVEDIPPGHFYEEFSRDGIQAALEDSPDTAFLWKNLDPHFDSLQEPDFLNNPLVPALLRHSVLTLLSNH